MREFISNNAVRQSFLDSLEKKPTRAQKRAATTTCTPEMEPEKTPTGQTREVAEGNARSDICSMERKTRG